MFGIRFVVDYLPWGDHRNVREVDCIEVFGTSHRLEVKQSLGCGTSVMI